MGIVANSTDEFRNKRDVNFIDCALRDLSYAIRTLYRSRGFAVLVILLMALGIGANTAIFSLLEGVVLRPLPYPQPERLVMVWETTPQDQRMAVSGPAFQDWQRDATTFQQVAGSIARSYDLTNPGTPERVRGREISSGFFSTFGVAPVLGREFSPSEDVRGGAPVVIIGERLWRDRFAGSAEVLGESISLDGLGYEIVGVHPSGTRFYREEADVYTPLWQSDPLISNDRTLHPVNVVGRMKAGVTIEQAQADMTVIQARLSELYPNASGGLGADVVPLKEAVVGDSAGILFLLLGAVGLVLLIACANIANLLLVRSSARTRDLAVRSALGATPGQIRRQLITESVLLAVAGGGVGLLVAGFAVGPVMAAVPSGLPRSEGVGVNTSVLLFTFGLAIVVGVLCGLAPALKSTNIDLQGVLREGRLRTRGTHRVQGFLVAGQMTLTLVLLVGATMLLRTVLNLWEVDPGFNTHNVVTFKVGLSPSITENGSTTRVAYSQLVERLQAIPDVETADLTTLVPLSLRSNTVPFWFGAEEPPSIASAPLTLMSQTGPDYLEAMGIPLLEGRYVNRGDTLESPQVIVINSVLASTYFPEGDAVGQTITFARAGSFTIVGVVGHVRHWNLGNPLPFTQNQTYMSFYQLPDEWVPLMRPQVSLLIRTPLEVENVMSAIRPVVYGASGDQPVYDVRTMAANIAAVTAPQRFPTILLGAFAVLAWVLAAVGIFGVSSYSMTQRQREIGIRMSLGAGKRNVLWMVIGRGFRPSLLGVGAGVVAALMLGRVLSSFSDLLYGIPANDPLTYLGASLMLTTTALLASCIPAFRAVRMSPVTVLRQE